MKETIYKEDAINAIKEMCLHYTPTKSVTHPHVDFVIEELMKLPSAQPERNRGKWIAYGDIPKTCSCCYEDWDKYVFGDVVYTSELPKFCPNCGADMKNKEDER